MKAKFICPLFVVRDMEVSRKFYENMLGQEVEYDFGENISFRGGFSIHLMSHYASLTGNSDIIFNSNNAELYFESGEINELRDALTLSGVRFVHDIREQPWRQQVMRFYDPDGHIIEVGEPLDYTARRLSGAGMDARGISEAMGVPQQAIDAWLQGQ
ncbi:hypothetical protein SDC9_28186 [bioreactor metagenome]|jgi:catechol 2,3-dioxygenase-like lactoylglutathione lyase family enzyme|uniref:VOC domain-containing protein n=1 Tax=bioreactor metagenome TaxID=1076179 RepID=A0A644UT41_9ZZZZ|nr:VOC family protein [Lentimicrobium sp.]MEA5109814.1 VOC family protein [Lentimicrobium sp.]